MNPDCSAQTRRGFYHFVSKDAFDIDGLGISVIDDLLDFGLIKDTADIFQLDVSDFYNLPLFKDKRATNLFEAIQNKKYISLERFIYALGIRYLGEKASSDIAKYLHANLKRTSKVPEVQKTQAKVEQITLFEDEKPVKKIKEDAFTPLDVLETIDSVKIEDIQNVEGIGEKVAEAVKEWFKEKENRALIKKFYNVGLVLNAGEGVKKTAITGKGFVLTGTLTTMTRSQAKTLIKQAGGDVHSSVSAKTDYVIAGESAGSKLNKAKELNVKIIDEMEFKKLLGAE
jgi:DNA ligase (NAD+)